MSASTPTRSRRLWVVIVLPWLAMACGAAPPLALPASPPTSSGSGDPADSAAAPSGEGEPAESASEPPPLMPFGVPECDNFIMRYVACVERRVPDDHKARLMDDLHEHRAKWRELSRMEQGKLAVGLSCRGVAQRLKGGLTVDYGCEF